MSQRYVYCVHKNGYQHPASRSGRVGSRGQVIYATCGLPTWLVKVLRAIGVMP